MPVSYIFWLVVLIGGVALVIAINFVKNWLFSRRRMHSQD